MDIQRVGQVIGAIGSILMMLGGMLIILPFFALFCILGYFILATVVSPVVMVAIALGIVAVAVAIVHETHQTALLRRRNAETLRHDIVEDEARWAECLEQPGPETY